MTGAFRSAGIPAGSFDFAVALAFVPPAGAFAFQ
jgi:hypothetical protein